MSVPGKVAVRKSKQTILKWGTTKAADVEEGASDTAKKQKTRTYNKNWENDFLWVVYNKEHNTMHCTTCVEAGCRNNFVTGTRDFQRSALAAHDVSESHAAAKQTAPLQRQAAKVNEAVVGDKEKRLLNHFVTAYSLILGEGPVHV